MTEMYERLRERLDEFPNGFPRTESHIELEVLRHLFTPEEAETAVSLALSPEPVSAIAQRTCRDESKLGEQLYDMSKKGLIWRRKGEGGQYQYGLVPWAFGIWEFQLNRLTKENAMLFERFHEEVVVPLRKKAKVPGFRVVPVQTVIETRTEIQPFEKVSEIIESNTRFAVAECICRKEAKLAGKGCDKLMDACMAFGPVADFYIENGLGREINKEEAKQVLAKAEESGLIHCSANHAGNKALICNCCGCCCHSVSSLVKHGALGALAKSNYYALLDKDSCIACGVCVDRCQVGAIRVQDDETIIDRDKCVGCGLCASTCPNESITMAIREPEERIAPFPSQKEMLQAITKDRKKPLQ